jgi:hypothetical protein
MGFNIFEQFFALDVDQINKLLEFQKLIGIMCKEKYNARTKGL